MTERRLSPAWKAALVLTAISLAVPLIVEIAGDSSAAQAVLDGGEEKPPLPPLPEEPEPDTGEGEILAWLDVVPNGSAPLYPRDFSEIGRNGGWAVDVGFSPNGTCLWFLVETTAENMTHLLNVSRAISVELAYNGSWPYWNRSWDSKSQVNPYDDNYSKRLSAMGASPPMVPVLVYYRNETQDGELNQTNTAQSVRNRVLELGGVVVNEGGARLVSARIPPGNLTAITSEVNVTFVTHNAPAMVFSDSVSGGRDELHDSPTDPWNVLFAVALIAPGISVSLDAKRLPLGRRIALSACIVTLLLASGPFATPATGLLYARQTVKANAAPNQGEGVTVCVIDLGVDRDHEDLHDAIVGGWNFRSTPPGPSDWWMDTSGHGTHVAGIIASRDERFRGIASAAMIYPEAIRGSHATEDISNALLHCLQRRNLVDPPIRVIQLSVGIPTTSLTGGTDALSDIADDVVEQGLVVVTAVGNYACEPDPPYGVWKRCWQTYSQMASSFNSIAVGAIDDMSTPLTYHDDRRACYSSYGRTTDGRRKPDVVAPGSHHSDCFYMDGREAEGIVSTRSQWASDGDFIPGQERIESESGGLFGGMQGTSMAAPMVSAQAAIILTANPDWTPNHVKDAVRRTAVLSELSEDQVGYGLIRVPESATTTLADGSLGWDTFSRYTPWPPLENKRFFYRVARSISPTGVLDPRLQQITVQHRTCILGFCWIDKSYLLLNRIDTSWVWIDYVSQALDSTLLLYGPRVYYSGWGGEFLRYAYTLPGSGIEVKVSYRFYTVTGITKITPEIELRTSSTSDRRAFWALSYYDFDILDHLNDLIRNRASGQVFRTETYVGGTDLRVEDNAGPLPRVEVIRNLADYPIEWLLRCCGADITDNPDQYVNGESIFRADVTVHYKAYRNTQEWNVRFGPSLSVYF